MVLDHRQSFIAALARGEKAALNDFYAQLKEASDDSAFWHTLTDLLPREVVKPDTEALSLFKRLVRSSTYDNFLTAAPVHVLVLFFAFAMLFASGCENGEQVEDIQVDIAAVEEAAGGAGGVVAEEAAPEEAAGPDVEGMSADELRTQLADYITKAELPASEKRRLKKVLKKAKEKKLVSSRTELAELFAKEDPAEIASTLEAMVLFQKTKKQRPRPMTKYKGVDYEEADVPEPMMQTLYKGVDFLES